LLIAIVLGLGAQSVPAGDAAEVRAAIERWAAGPAQDSAAFVGQYADSVSQSFIGGTHTRALSRQDIARRLPRERMVGRDVTRAEIIVDTDTAWVSPVLLRDSYGDFDCIITLLRSGGSWLITDHDYLRRVAPELHTVGLGPEYISLTERWARWNLAWCDSTLRANPPNGGDRRLRRQAHHMLDEPLHLNSAPMLQVVREYHRSRIDAAIAEMRTEIATSGAIIWKLYNHGFVVRTASHTWGHDVYEGPGEMAMRDDQVDAILGEVDALFCSHWHGDHSSSDVIQRALELGVPVMVSSFPDRDYVRHMKQAIGFGDDDTPPPGLTVVAPGSSGDVAGLAYHAYPGHQGDFTNNVFVVEADSMAIMQTGDQSNDDDFAWIDGVGDERRVDVLLPNVWTTDMTRVINGVRPRVVIPGHENEMGHNFEHREPYTQAYERLEGYERSSYQPAAWYVLAWGERVHIEPADTR